MVANKYTGSADIEALAGQISELAPAYREFRKTLDDSFARMRQEWIVFAEQLQEAFKALRQIDWGEIDRKVTEESLRLAELGWTIAPWMTLPQVTQLAALDSDAIDQEFSNFYFEEGGLETTKNNLITSSRLERWRPLLPQIFAAIDRKDYLIAIPSLLLVLEGFVAQFAEPTNSQLVCSTNVPRMIKAIQPSASPKSVSARLWASTMAFLDQLYKRAPFSEQCPTFLNRHWILHGRNATEWDAADALRILNALVTLNWLMEVQERQRPKEA